jgi:hypothetical protein
MAGEAVEVDADPELVGFRRRPVQPVAEQRVVRRAAVVAVGLELRRDVAFVQVEAAVRAVVAVDRAADDALDVGVVAVVVGEDVAAGGVDLEVRELLQEDVVLDLAGRRRPEQDAGAVRAGALARADRAVLDLAGEGVADRNVVVGDVADRDVPDPAGEGAGDAEADLEVEAAAVDPEVLDSRPFGEAAAGGEPRGCGRSGSSG